MPKLLHTELENLDKLIKDGQRSGMLYDQLSTEQERTARLQEAVSMAFESFCNNLSKDYTAIGNSVIDNPDHAAVLRVIQERRSSVSDTVNNFKEMMDTMAGHINMLVEERKPGASRDTADFAKVAVNSWQKDLTELSNMLANAHGATAGKSL